MSETPTDSRAKDIARYSFLVALANDKVIDKNELAFIEKLVLKDGVCDEEEKDVLRKVFARVDEQSCSEEDRQAMNEFRQRYGI